MRVTSVLFLIFLATSSAQAAAVTFKARELFRLPFGTGTQELGAKTEGGNFIIPRDFTMDAAGHFYIYDTNHHRIARFSSQGKYEIGFQYPRTAQQVFAHADARENLWLLVTDPVQGMFYGVYDPRGKRLNAGLFSRFNQFRLHLDDSYTLHVILSSAKDPGPGRSFILDERSLLLKKETTAPPPETHHQVRKSDRVYYIDRVPDGEKEDARHVNRITDESHRGIGNIQGSVVYVTDRGEIYTRVGKREIAIYDVDGSLKGKVHLQGLSSACASLRFDAFGNIYELDGIPDLTDQELRRREAAIGPGDDAEDLHYSSQMTGMRLIQWEHP